MLGRRDRWRGFGGGRCAGGSHHCLGKQSHPYDCRCPVRIPLTSKSSTFGQLHARIAEVKATSRPFRAVFP